MVLTLPRFKPGMAAKAGFLAVSAALAFQAGDSKAASWTCSIDTLQTGIGNCLDENLQQSAFGGTIILGDKSITNFNFGGVQYDPGDTMLFTNIFGTDYQFQYNFNPIQASNAVGNSGTFSYDVAVIGTGYEFDSIQSNITGSTFNSTGSFTTTVSTNPAVTPATATAGSAPGGISPSLISYFNAGVTSATFTQTFSSTNNSVINSLGVTLIQRSTEAVPGPLPILAAGAAFGFSRKLRRRVQLSRG